MKTNKFLCFGLTAIGFGTILLGCAQQPSISSSNGHISQKEIRQAPPAPSARSIPAPVKQTVFLPEPKPQKAQETYTISVQDVPVKELLFAIARDASLNLDIQGEIEGAITLNAVDQTLPKILDRLSRQASIRYELEGENLIVMADDSYLKAYRVEYLNMSRVSTSNIETSTGIDNGLDSSSENEEGNASETGVENESNNLFWNTITDNLVAILSDEDDTSQSSSSGSTGGSSAQSSSASGGSSAQNSGNRSVIVNRETGVVYIRGNSRQHKDVQTFLDEVMSSARRQVLIEATVAEVSLSHNHQFGVDWERLVDNYSLGSLMIDTSLATAPTFLLSRNGETTTTVLRMLEQYGDVRVLSSPKIMALNNQTSLLKVVDNKVYFTVSLEATTDEETNTTTETYETTAHSVPIGFIMNVTPYISESEEVILNIRPTITRIIDYVNDPNPQLAQYNIENRIPEVQIREMESVLRVDSGQTAVIGGLMQDSIDNDDNKVPWISQVPFVGKAFGYESKSREKTELVIFLKPTLIKTASINSDLKKFQRYLPSENSQE